MGQMEGVLRDAQSEQAVREALEKIDTKAYRDADQAGTGGSKDP